MSLPKNTKGTFVDLFAGIGGFRLGFEKAGFECVFSAEINEHAREVYKANFGDDPLCDITKLKPNEMPEFDILCAGFPCQAFSISGKQKGFEDTRGTLFFDLCRIIEDKLPKIVVLENVHNLEKHDNGKTLSVILDSLSNFGYTINYKVLNAKDFGVPQNRQRIIIVANRENKYFDFEKLELSPSKPMKYYLQTEGEFEYLAPEEYTILQDFKQQPKSGLIFIGYRNKKIRTTGVREGTEHLSRVHKQPNRIYSAEGMHPTIASQEQSGRYWIYNNNQVRKLTLNECFTFMGFPPNYIKLGTKSKLYERIGNSICVPMVNSLANEIYNQLFMEVNMDQNPKQFLEDIYNEAKSLDTILLTKSQLNFANTIVEKEATNKGVFTVLVSSLTYKCLNPTQDIRYHQCNLPNGYSGRSFDTKYVTPFLKEKHFLGAMKESGWLTRSLEQPYPYTLDFGGKINNKKVKEAFLNIIDDIQTHSADAKNYLLTIFHYSILHQEKNNIILINPIERNSEFNISEIIDALHKHFYYDYRTRGASILPVIALYSMWECLIYEEFPRYKNKSLEKLASHYSCDKSSKAVGDIEVKNSLGDCLEAIEVKFEIAPTSILVDDIFKKISSTPVQRYYILSTVAQTNTEELNKITNQINKIKEQHGCEIIVNGVFETIKYYLRLLENPTSFISAYINNLGKNTEINSEQKVAWNLILKI
ncbi:MAG: DNA (cytosine-5-)-methyltransferase [Epulopiscium sp. Nele67-Bin005]|nr:MAG: DNA (cytosine-5-)-methyltransferase [Epulopiscium sp. Nele67-Bin005]